MNLLSRIAVVGFLPGVLFAQDFTVVIPDEVKETVGELLPERSNAGAAFISESYDSNLTFNANATVRITFLHEGAGYKNTLGYFTFTEGVNGAITINSAGMLIEDLTMPSVVQSGYGYDLRDAGGSIRTFTSGEKLGFFLIGDGKRRASTIVNNWVFNYSDSDGQVPDPDPVVNASRGRGLYTTISSLNPENLDGQPEKARHLALIEVPGVAGFLGGDDFMICGFEDLRRSRNSDEDFNDLVFLVEASPKSAIAGTIAFRYNPNDPDADGVYGLNDAFPNDPDRATFERIPSHGMTTIAFEDRYPELGDADFNDAAIGYVYELTKDSLGNVKDIQLTVALVARGALYESAFGVHLPGLPATATGSVRVERFDSGATASRMAANRTVQQIIVGNRRVEDLIDSARTMLPPQSGSQYSNTLLNTGLEDAASARLHIEFDVAVPESLLGAAPYDPFLLVENPRFPDVVVDIHLPGKASFADRPSYLPVESGQSAFIDSNGFPWALEIPSTWRFPMEAVDIDDAYSLFEGYRTSGGELNKLWHLDAYSASGLVGPTLESLLPVRVWSIGIPY